MQTSFADVEGHVREREWVAVDASKRYRTWEYAAKCSNRRL